jgi:carbamoyl-phosphate synthase small subunit
MAGADLSAEVTTPEPYVVPARGERRHTVAALDLGIKAMTPAPPGARGVEVHVLPATGRPSTTSWPSSPTGCSSPTARATRPPPTTQVALLQQVLAARIPFFGICFGNQLLGRALGFGTYKLAYGHRGINQPVLDRHGQGRGDRHNHGFAVEAPLDEPVDTPYGRRRSPTCASTTTWWRAGAASAWATAGFSVQYHPEAAAGPHDAAYLFDRFVDLRWRGAR